MVNTYYEKTLGVWIHAANYAEAKRLAYVIHKVDNPVLQRM